MRFILYFVFLRWFIRILFCAQQDPIERLYVSIEGDFSNLLDSADEGVEKTKDKLGELDKEGQKAGGGVKRGAALAGAAFGLAAGAASKLLDVIVNIASSAVQMFKNMAGEAIQLASDFEQVQMTFTNIFKDEAQANKFLSDLRGQATSLGISFNDAAQFAKSIYPDTKNAEEFNRILKNAAIGAADAGLPLRELIFSFNEAVAGDFTSIRDRLDIPREVIERIKASPDIVAALNEELEKLFAKRGVDNLEAMSGTFEGLKRQIAGFREGLLGLAGAKILEPLREGLQNIVGIIKEYGPLLNYVAEQLGEIIAMILGFGKDETEKIFSPIAVFRFVESLKSGVEWLKETAAGFVGSVKAAKAFVDQLEPAFNVVKLIVGNLIGGLVSLIAKFTGTGLILDMLSEKIQEAGGFFNALNRAFIAGAQGVAILSATITGLTETVRGAWESIKGLGNLLVAIATGDIKAIKDAMLQFNDGVKQATTGAVGAFKDSILESAKSIDAMISPTKEAADEIENLGNKLEETGEKAEDAAPLLDPQKLESYTDQLIKATEARNEQLEKLEADHGQKMTDIINDANDKALDIEQKYNDDLAKLAGDSEKERLKVIEDTRRELADLATETDRELETRRKDFNKSELRETEDHLKEMRRLQEDYLFNLEDAVRDRDAGAIVDLQRQFQRESSRREEDFSTGQNRQEQDFDQELQDIRENEASKREELLAAQAQELADIQANEEEKRLELEMRRQEENEKLQQNLQEQLQKEQESYEQRQQALNDALQNQLEAIAEGLAKEKDITEEGAREILEKFDEYFGIGGNIDELMTDFARRRKIRADITVAFGGAESEPAEAPTAKEAITSGGSFGGRKRLGGVQEFAAGGTMVATKPTLALFGEAGPEIAQFTPMSQLSNPGNQEPGRMVIEMTGSAPPGIGTGERDQIAAVLLSALQETGALN